MILILFGSFIPDIYIYIYLIGSIQKTLSSFVVKLYIYIYLKKQNTTVFYQDLKICLKKHDIKLIVNLKFLMLYIYHSLHYYLLFPRSSYLH